MQMEGVVSSLLCTRGRRRPEIQVAVQQGATGSSTSAAEGERDVWNTVLRSVHVLPVSCTKVMNNVMSRKAFHVVYSFSRWLLPAHRHVVGSIVRMSPALVSPRRAFHSPWRRGCRQ